MAESREPAPKKRRLVELREEDPALEARRRLSLFVDRLLRFVTRPCVTFIFQDCPKACFYYRSLDNPRCVYNEQRPEVQLCEMLGLHERKTLEFLAMSVAHFPQETALMFETLEAAWFEGDPRTPIRENLPSGPRLTYFRMAQSIRNQHGISRGIPDWPCFNSFEDIIELEKALANHECIDFMLQCVALTDDASIEAMFACTWTHWEIKSLYLGVSNLGRLTPSDLDAYTDRFEFLTGDFVQNPVTPDWFQLETYLEQPKPMFVSNIKDLFNVEVPSKKLDEAFRRVTSYIIRCFAPDRLRCAADGYRESHILTANKVNAAANALLLLLRRGASLEYREPHDFLHCEQSSLGALIELADMVSSFPLTELLPYICCPLAREEDEVKFDCQRLARLSCLAARNIPTLKNDSRLPSCFRSFVRMHQDLRSQLGNRRLRIAMIRRRVLGDVYPVDYLDVDNFPPEGPRMSWSQAVLNRWTIDSILRRPHRIVDDAIGAFESDGDEESDDMLDE